MKKKAIPCHKAGRITSFFLLISIFLLMPSITTPVYAAKTYAQQTVFTLHASNKTVKEVFEYIEENSEFVVLYSKDLLPVLQKKVSISIDKQDVESILNILSKEAGLKYNINDRQITVTKVAAEAPQQEKKEIKVTGKVLDENDEGVPGANVVVKGDKTKGTMTDIEGNFTLTVPANTVLVASFIGYTPTEFPLNGKTNVILKIAPDAKQLDEVVVVGFGAQKKASVVGAVQTVKASELRSPSSTLSNSFAGRIAGVVAVQRGGEPGADGANFWIRGISTFASNTSPLVFIDNVEVSIGDLNALSPEVIEGFSILKDATATALYGARGANGVMLITTRNGKDMEKARINIRVQNSFTQPTKTVKVADGIDYMIARNDAVLNRTPNAQPYYSEEVIEGTRKQLNPYIYPNVDWENYLFKDFTTTQSANVNVTGGGKRVTYFLSGTLNNDNGMLKKDSKNNFDNNINQLRLSLQANVGVNLTSTTKANVRLNAQVLDYSGSAAGTDAIYQGIFEAPPVMFAPVLPAQNGEDYILFGNRNGGPVSGRYRNPYAEMVRGYSEKNESTMIASLDLEQDLKFIVPGLKAKGLISFKNWATTNVVRSFDPYFYGIKDYEQGANGEYTYTYEAITKGSKALSTSTSNGGDRLLNYQLSLDYAQTFADKHNVGAMLVYLQRDYNQNAPADFYATLPVRNQGIAGRVTYGYDDRYMIEANFGYNGSENFGEGKRFGFFPSVAIGYNISNENFFTPLRKVISNLKIRGSYGKVGNSSTDSRFPYLTYVNLSGASYIFGNNWQNKGTGAIITRYGAAGARWETGIKADMGVELNLFNSLNITFDWFTETRKDIFMRRNIVPAESGITGDLRPYANLGKVKNQGVDLNIEYNKAFSRDLIASLKGSFTYAKNTLLEADEPSYPEEEAYRSEIGKPLNRYTGLIAMGLFKDEADVENSPEQTFSPNLKPGDIKYKDLNGDGKIDSNDMTEIGDPTVPQIVYGFGGSVQYKSFDFSVFFQGVAKTSLMMQNIHPFTSDQTTLLDFIAKDYWTEENPNPNAEYPRLISNLDSHNNFMNSTYWLRSAAFLRLKNVEIGYTYKVARLFISGQNLLTFSPFKHWDPELGGGKGLTYPNLRVATIGLQLTF
ncbi:SusC/RagA family TonB-linked outer membrane protein [Bacteroides fragilis]|jgi:TonB-linked SusC/RagA family outer membrane protein|uniref:SusC/RagA family TonB-linked outer membrane protein n=1 Tax=Bacteroides fragilis TaxID=817 RepID=A0A413K6U5_BACFG|nr:MULTISPECIES: SusC/RagA family TonB-linked outer membrane protein [Bacteroides]MBU3040299.1 TonB-dependent receptor [Bacteroides sp. HF-4919]MBY2895926.1 membrane protein [Bacteroides fragilis]MCM0221359.1 TonB-dependent receptor [Bacteroides fragilis]MCM0298681.1 TonB-dependent receptor [Bacteroides fragilis]MCM0359191.1 TonB-dependent receptor [Bacteroides fragilis]